MARGLHRQVMPDGSALPYLYSGPGVEVEVERNAEGYAPASRAVVTIRDYANLTVYGIEAEEDAQGRARLVSLAVSVTDDANSDSFDPVGYLGDRPERSRAWLARVAIECARGEVLVAESDDEARLRYIAATVQRCEREHVSAVDTLATALHLGKRTVSRRIADAVAAGLLPERTRGRPSTSPRKDTSDA